MISTYIFTAECSDQVCLVSSVAADCDWETTSLEKPTALGGGADIGAGGLLTRACPDQLGRTQTCMRKCGYIYLLKQSKYVSILFDCDKRAHVWPAIRN